MAHATRGASAAPAFAADSIATFVESKRGVAARFLALAAVGVDDVVWDLGCGDARVLLEVAAATGCRCVGVEADARVVALARAAVAAAPPDCAARVTIVHGDATAVPVSAATVVYLFLTRYGVLRVRPGLLDVLRPGARIVTCMTAMGSG